MSLRSNGVKVNGRGAKTAACPVCGAPVVPAYRPFCSKRCADVDLGRWLKGNYTIPARDEEEMD